MRARIPDRVRILVGCEGESEQSYSRFLDSLARDSQAYVHIDAVVMKGGDPLSRLEWLERHIRAERRRRGTYAHQFAFIDTDQDHLNAARASAARHLADQLNVTVIWQEPVHEGILVRHFDGFTTHRPPTAAASMALLQRLWASYVKNLPAVHYRAQLNVEDVRRAATVEPQLSALLKVIHL